MTESDRPSPLPTPPRTLLLWGAVAAVLSGLIWQILPVLSPFMIAACLAYMLRPAVVRLSARRVPRPLAALVVEIAALGLMAGVVLLIVPVLSRQLPLLREQIPMLAQRINTELLPWLASLGVTISLDVDSIRAFVVKHLNANIEELLTTVLGSMRIGGSFVLALVGNAVLVPVVLYYMLLDGTGLRSRLRVLVPSRWHDAVTDYLRECDEVLRHYLRGQLRVIAALSAYYTVALLLAGFDLALPLGVLSGVSLLVPYLGFGVACALALLAGVLQFAGTYGVAAVLVIYGAGQVLEGFVLTPYWVGERIGLHPLAVIFLLLAFGHLFGLVGVLIALPAGAMLLVSLRRLREMYHRSSLYRG